jgi:hypothetical protein
VQGLQVLGAQGHFLNEFFASVSGFLDQFFVGNTLVQKSRAETHGNRVILTKRRVGVPKTR